MNNQPMVIRAELLDDLLQEYKRAEDLLGSEGILKQLTQALVERCLNLCGSIPGSLLRPENTASEGCC